MLSAAALSSYAYVAPAAPAVKAPAMIRMEEGNAVAQFEGPAPTAGLESLAAEQNPILGFWDPLSIVNEETMPETIVRRAPQRPPRFACPGVPRALCPS